MAYIRGWQFKNISANTGGFNLPKTGRYAVMVNATWSAGSVTLARLSSDASTWVTISTYTANTYETQDLPGGTYRFGVTTSTGVYAEIRPIAEFDDL